VERWCIPPQANGALVAAMEALLDLYARPADPRAPLVCFDEAGKELQTDARPSTSLGPGFALRQDYEYIRHGSANLFLWCAPHTGQRGVAVTAQRTITDFAHAMRRLVDEEFPHADKIILVLDNLNTHTPGALYQTFAPELAHRLMTKLEFHYTPKHGSWLNIAELEFSVLARQCLDRRIGDAATLAHEVAAWAAERTAAAVPITWRFSTADARTRLAHLYPIPSTGQ